MRVGKYILASIFIIFVIINTFLLFTFNRFSNSTFGGITIIGLKSDILNYKKGSLVILKKNIISSGDDILFYDSRSNNYICNEKVIKKLDKKTYVIRDNEYVSDEYVVGKISDIKVIPFIGYLYNIFTSKIGYLIFIIIPITLYFALLIRNYKKS